MHTVNLGILAHVDAGKTSLTERLLHTAGVIPEVGRVDDGNTQTDSLALERQRGITIKAAVVSFPIGDLAVNVIDTPGHPDFIAEVERVLSVLDGAVLVVSAVEGVQAQTRVLMRTLRRLRIPTLVFVNKIDRSGAREGALLRELAAKLTPAVLALNTVRGLGTRDARSLPYDSADAGLRSALLDTLTAYDERLLAEFVADEARLDDARLRAELVTQTGRGLLHPVFFGSAHTGAGVAELTAGITELLPRARGERDAPATGTVFKVERGPAGERLAYLRLLAGTVRARDRLWFGEPRAATPRGEAKVTAVRVFAPGPGGQAAVLTAGQIGAVRGLTGVRIGDVISAVEAQPSTPTPTAAPAAAPLGAPPGAEPPPTGPGAVDNRPRGWAAGAGTTGQHFAPPTLETVIAPHRATDRPALHLALAQLAEADPLINLRQGGDRQELFLSLYGEVQKEVIEATLAQEFGVAVVFRRTSTIHVERVIGSGSAVEVMHAPGNPFLATVGLRVEPAAEGSGVAFRLAVELGALPHAFTKAIEETVRETLGQGLYGWAVPDCVVTLTRSGYAARQSHAHGVFDKSMSSTAGDFRKLTPLVLLTALRRAATRVHEPMHHFHLEVPADTVGVVLPVLARLGAVPRPQAVRGEYGVLEGEIPAAAVHALEQRLTGLTRGEALLDYSFAGYRPVHGAPPTRQRTDHDPLDRKEYLLRVVRNVTGGTTGRLG
ncbi:GTP-binding protein [Streptomyces sp. 796.1]|uniref:GTP-binding protein n=1 Tax=Streptomyces sp. 796.1 TaxID=3163029 RepID=UPI0039C923F7